MAETPDGEEKTEQATDKRLDQMRSEGNIPRSKELNSAAMTLVGAFGIILFGRSITTGMMEMMTRSLSFTREDLLQDPTVIIRRFFEVTGDSFFLIAPLIAWLMVTSLLSSVFPGGVNWSPLKLKFSNMNPIKGLHKLVSVNGLMELGKSLVKFFIIAGLVWLIVKSSLGKMLALQNQDATTAIWDLGSMLSWSFVKIAATLLLLAGFDVPYQMWSWQQKAKMTKQEVKDEWKNAEGNAMVKGKIRNMMRQMAAARMMQDVPKADVIVTNPSHFAVALRYDQAQMGAPKVIAKGRDLVAENIRKVGGEARVPIITSPPLARALYFNVEVGDPIPAGLYVAVAKILAYVFQLRAGQTGGSPPKPGDLPIPPDLKR